MSNFSNYKKFENVGIRSSNDTLIVMDSSNNNISLHSSDGGDDNVDTLSIKNIINKTPNMDLNLSSLNGTTINPVITINNNHSDCRITTNLNVNGNLNITKNLIIPTHSATSTLLANVKGSIYYNTSENMYEGYSQTEGWQPLGGFSKTKDAVIHKNLNVIGNINLTNEGMIKTTGIGSFGSITTTGSITSTTGSITTNNQDINAGSGTVTANTFSGALSGNATTATTATTATSAGVSDNVKIDSASNSGSQYYLVFADGSGNSIRLKVATNIKYTPSTDLITASAESVKLNYGNSQGSTYYIPFSSSNSGNSCHLYTDSSYLLFLPSENRIYTGSVKCSSGSNYFYGNVAIGYTSGTVYWPLDVRGYYKGTQSSNMWNAQDHNDGFWIAMTVPHDLPTEGSINGHFRNYDLDVESDAANGIWKARITAHFKYSIYCSDGGFMASSDERIKYNIEDVEDTLALEIIRKIETKTYNYYDVVGRGRDGTIGFIAQNVRKYFPTAVKIITNFIPNILKKINVSWQSFTENNETKYKMSTTDLTNIIGIKYKFYVDNNSDGRNEKEIEVIGNDDNTFTFDEKWNYVFCYGTEVDDFHSLDKDKIFTLHHSGIQELDRQQIADKERITNLETANQQQQTKIDTLETEISTLKTENTELKSIIDKLKTANSFEEFKQTF